MKKFALLIILLALPLSISASTGVFYASSAGHVGYDSHCGQTLNEKINLVGGHVGNTYFATFNNSFNKQSFVFSKRYMGSHGMVNIGMHAGLVHGYSVQYLVSCDGNQEPDTLPFLAPVIELDLGKVNVNFIVLGTAYTMSIGVEL